MKHFLTTIISTLCFSNIYAENIHIEPQSRGSQFWILGEFINPNVEHAIVTPIRGNSRIIFSIYIFCLTNLDVPFCSFSNKYASCNKNSRNYFSTNNTRIEYSKSSKLRYSQFKDSQNTYNFRAIDIPLADLFGDLTCNVSKDKHSVTKGDCKFIHKDYFSKKNFKIPLKLYSSKEFNSLNLNSMCPNLHFKISPLFNKNSK